MDRRQLILAAGAALSSAGVARGAFAQAPAPAVAKLKIDTYSRHLLWLRHQLTGSVADLVVVTTGDTAYRRRDGVAVVPLALLGA